MTILSHVRTTDQQTIVPGKLKSVRTYLGFSAPRWLLGTIYGVYFGLVMGLSYHFAQHKNGLSAVIGGVAAGTLFGFFMSRTVTQQRRTLARIAEPISADDLIPAYESAAKGPLPANHEIRAASGRIVAYRLARLERQRTGTYVVFGLFPLLGLYLVFTSGRIWWIAVALFASFPIITYRQRRRLRDRATLYGVSAADAPDEANKRWSVDLLQFDRRGLAAALVRFRYWFLGAAIIMTGLAIWRIDTARGNRGIGEVIVAMALWAVAGWSIVRSKAAQT